MIPAALVGLSLVVMAAFDPDVQSPLGNNAHGIQMSPQQKAAVMRPLVRSATDCVIRAVVADPQFRHASAPDINNLIVASMTRCLEPVRAMIDAHDRVFGEGSGEAFFMGPYLDGLPATVTRQVKGEPQEKMAP
jgi:hypothetical protein